LRAWTHALDVKLLPKLHPDFPLVVAICGGGSAGKSTLFNSLVGRPVSPMGGRAGLNRRVLAALNEPTSGRMA
jgi:nicotinamide riboside kinase